VMHQCGSSRLNGAPNHSVQPTAAHFVATAAGQ
jgi:hypothetical protein